MYNSVCGALITILIFLFFFLSKSESPLNFQGTSFECGFSSYFFSRFSFSIHYFGIALIFLFLDLELCFLLPLFSEEFSSFKELFALWFIAFIMILGLIKEWEKKELDWKF